MTSGIVFLKTVREVANETYYIFYPPFVLIAGVFAWAGILLIFQSYNVPYRQVLNLPNYQYLSAHDTFKLGSYMFLNMITWMGLHILLRHWECTRAALIVAIIAYISPVTYVGYLWFFHRNSLTTLCQTLWNVLIPIRVPSFREIFLTDLVTSLAKILSDMTSVILSMIYLLGGSKSIFDSAPTILLPIIVTCLPFGYRLLQSLLLGYNNSDRIQFLNAFKHASSILGIFWSANLALDFVLRVCWAVRFIDPNLNDYRILLGLSIAEILRRFLWIVIRIVVQIQAIARLRPPIKQLEVVIDGQPIKVGGVPCQEIDGWQVYVYYKTKNLEKRKQTFKRQLVNKRDNLLLRAREKHEYMAKNARLEKIWKRRKGNGIHEMCNIYDVVRVGEEEEIPKKVEQTEDMSLEDSQMLCNFLPLLREYLPEVASEIQSDIYSYVSSSEGALHMVDDYVYDSYAVKDEMNTAEEEGDLDAYPLVLVGGEDDYYDGQQESEWDTSDSNAEDNPLNEYPDEVSSSEEETDEDEDDEDEDEEGVTRVNGFRELDEFRKTKTLHSSEDEYSYEDEDEEEDDD
ncbi:hypothetical protein MKW98_020648 [Papaver atlanticum]|uniref:EXS domain-containing protein n=1 Tax=Papaver atlanticum TaxID=357466 RepID=A0AAD4TJN4_9MAGN|nr:hypothetical protein MKW98_020648 [Papaver atlanticum]